MQMAFREQIWAYRGQQCGSRGRRRLATINSVLYTAGSWIQSESNTSRAADKPRRQVVPAVYPDDPEPVELAMSIKWLLDGEIRG